MKHELLKEESFEEDSNTKQNEGISPYVKTRSEEHSTFGVESDSPYEPSLAGVLRGLHARYGDSEDIKSLATIPPDILEKVKEDYNLNDSMLEFAFRQATRESNIRTRENGIRRGLERTSGDPAMIAIREHMPASTGQKILDEMRVKENPAAKTERKFTPPEPHSADEFVVVDSLEIQRRIETQFENALENIRQGLEDPTERYPEKIRFQITEFKRIFDTVTRFIGRYVKSQADSLYKSDMPVTNHFSVERIGVFLRDFLRRTISIERFDFFEHFTIDDAVRVFCKKEGVASLEEWFSNYVRNSLGNDVSTSSVSSENIATRESVLEEEPVLFRTKFDEAQQKEREDIATRINTLTEKTRNQQTFTRDELVFLYHTHCNSHPGINNLRSSRKKEEDMLVIFECTPDQIAYTPNEVNENTKAYIGPLAPGIFQRFPKTLEHIYTSFPENKINREDVQVGGMTKESLTTAVEDVDVYISPDAKFMIMDEGFVVDENPTEITIISLTSKDLGMKEDSPQSLDVVLRRAQEIGLELCPSDTALAYCVEHKNKPVTEYVSFCTDPIKGRDGRLYIFHVQGIGSYKKLDRAFAGTGNVYTSENRFVFCLPKK